ncbi:MAG: hypothetical protein ACLFSM_05770 [Thermoplasmata archaeon]
MTTKTIKNVDEEDWNEFRSRAAKANVPLGTYFKVMLEESEKRTEEFWDKIFSSEKLLNEEEAENLEKEIDRLREERGFRDADL